MTIGELATQLVPFVSVKRPNYRDLTVLIQVGHGAAPMDSVERSVGRSRSFPEMHAGGGKPKAG